MRAIVLHVLALVAASQAAAAAASAEPLDGSPNRAPRSYPLRRVRQDPAPASRKHSASSVRCVDCGAQC